jgi:hypothetical protein
VWLTAADVATSVLVLLNQARKMRAGYAGAITFVDGQIGKIVNQIEALGHREDTIVAFWADHGWALGEHGIWCKQANYELETRVPLMIRASFSPANTLHSNSYVHQRSPLPLLFGDTNESCDGTHASLLDYLAAFGFSSVSLIRRFKVVVRKIAHRY